MAEKLGDVKCRELSFYVCLECQQLAFNTCNCGLAGYENDTPISSTLPLHVCGLEQPPGDSLSCAMRIRVILWLVSTCMLHSIIVFTLSCL